MTSTQTKTTSELELAARLRLALMRLARRLRQQGEQDVTPSMLSALSTVERHGTLTLGALAEAERVAPPTMTKIVGRLEEAGLVTRTRDASDRRVAYVELSNQGIRFIDRARSRRNAYLAKKLRSLPPDDLAKLEAACEVLEKLLEERS